MKIEKSCVVLYLHRVIDRKAHLKDLTLDSRFGIPEEIHVAEVSLWHARHLTYGSLAIAKTQLTCLTC